MWKGGDGVSRFSLRLPKKSLTVVYWASYEGCNEIHTRGELEFLGITKDEAEEKAGGLLQDWISGPSDVMMLTFPSWQWKYFLKWWFERKGAF